MNRFAFVIVAFSLLFGAIFAADSVSYANSNGLDVSRILEVNKTGRLNIVLNTAEYVYTSTVTLTIKNTGAFEKPGVVVAEALNLPKDANVAYTPEPVSVQGANGWNIGTIAPGESKKIVAVVDSELGKDWLTSLPAPAISVEQVKAVLLATGSVSEGENVRITLTTEQAQPIGGAKVTAVSPSGKKIEMMTDDSGNADYKATEAGSYLYIVDGYSVASTPETQVTALIKSSPITASVHETTPASEGVLSQFTMVIAGFMVVSLILLAVIAYYSMRGEEEPEGPKRVEEEDEEEAPEPRGEYEEPAKKNNFRDEAARIERAREMTRKILEARKKELAAKGKKKK